MTLFSPTLSYSHSIPKCKAETIMFDLPSERGHLMELQFRNFRKKEMLNCTIGVRKTKFCQALSAGGCSFYAIQMQPFCKLVAFSCNWNLQLLCKCHLNEAKETVRRAFIHPSIQGVFLLFCQQRDQRIFA